MGRIFSTQGHRITATGRADPALLTEETIPLAYGIVPCIVDPEGSKWSSPTVVSVAALITRRGCRGPNKIVDTSH